MRLPSRVSLAMFVCALGTVIVVAVLEAACGDGRKNPVAPSPITTVSIAGNWVGTATFTDSTGGPRQIVNVTATFSQSGVDALGQYQMLGGACRTCFFPIRGNISAQLTGATIIMTQDFSAPNSLFAGPGPTCTGSAQASGVASSTELRWTVPTIQSRCFWFTNIEFVLTRESALPPPSAAIRLVSATRPAGSTMRVSPMFGNGQQAPDLWFTVAITSDRELSDVVVQAWVRTPEVRCMGGGAAGVTLAAGREVTVTTGSMSNPGGTQPVCALPYETTHVEVLVLRGGTTVFQQQFAHPYRFVAAQ